MSKLSSLTTAIILMMAFACLFLLSTSFQVQELLSYQDYFRAMDHTLPPSSSASSDNLTAKILSLALQKAPVGKLGPKNTPREKYRYYDALFYTALQFGSEAKSLIEVGCASDPFIKYFDWIDKRTCVAPYFVQYSGGKAAESDSSLTLTKNPIESVVADFMKYQLEDHSYDLLICSQVVEHVPNPSAFMKKLIRAAKISVISVPYKWGSCGGPCHHLTDNISYDLLLKWSKPNKPVYTSIVQENDGAKRIILVFKPEEQ